MNSKKITYDPNTTNFLEYTDIEEIIVPSSIKIISKRAFANFHNLKKVTIEEGVEIIDDEVFLNCFSLQEVILPNSLKEMNNGVFKNCSNLTTINIPQTITTLKDEVFKGCKKLNIKLDNIEATGNSTFEDCHNLKEYPTNIIKMGTSSFKNCRNLTNITLNEKLYYLPDKTFEGCKNLKHITSNNIIPIGKACFKNCYSLKSTPDFISAYSDNAFENCTGLEELIIKFSHIPSACFRGCTNIKKVIESDKIYTLGNHAFSGCKSIKEINLSSLTIIPSEGFSNCQNLTKVTLSPFTKKINSRAFYKCSNLKIINLSDLIEHIGNEAFRYCHSIPSITLPANLKKINNASFGSMDSLENIYISPLNKNFTTADNKAILDKTSQRVLLYASGSKDKTYSLIPQIVVKDNDTEYINPINYIGPHAFVGTKHLEEFIIGTSVTHFDNFIFEDNSKLKTLTIEGVDFFTLHNFDLSHKSTARGSLGLTEIIKENYKYPFETINYQGRIDQISSFSLVEFPYVKEINILTNGPTKVCHSAFSSQKNLKKIFLPECVVEVEELAFPKETIVWISYPNKELIDFENETLTQIFIDEQITDSIENVKVLENFQSLSTYKKSDKYKEEYKEYKQKDGYFITTSNKAYNIKTKTINENCTNAHLITNTPSIYIEYTNTLKEIDLYLDPLLNGILISNLNIANREHLFKEIKRYPFILDELETILNNKQNITNILKDIDQFTTKIKLLHELNISDESFRYPKVFTLFSNDDFKELLTNNQNLFKKFIIESLSIPSEDVNNNLIDHIISNDNTNKETKEDGNKVLKYLQLLKTTNKIHKRLLNKTIAFNCNNLCEKLIKNYDKHLDRALLASHCLNNKQNFLDLLNLLEITGCLEEDKLTRQKNCTFVTEKLFAPEVSSNKKNKYQIIGDNVHRFFNFNDTTVNYNKDFADFFITNYKEIIENEANSSFANISRIYANFDDLKKVSIANNGSRRQLKVTLDKCISFFTLSKFPSVKKEHLPVAKVIHKWCDNEEEINTCIKLYEESQHAPRNIFTEVKSDELNKPIYDNNSNNDLKEDLKSDYSYEWLPKQDPNNIILGNYCNCCAHFKGAGKGIVKASMTLSNCQNLVIRDELGVIIGKATLAINRKEKYGVYNTFESSFSKSTDEDKEKMYQALIRGTNAFLEVYNNNNKDNEINIVTMGESSNTITTTLTGHNHPPYKTLKSINYTDNNGYQGNWQGKQILIKKL